MHQSATVRSLCLFLVTFSLVLLLACDDDRHLEPNPDAPEFLETRLPADNAEIVTSSITLQWEAEDPDGDDLTYDLYLSTTYPPGVSVSNLSDDEYVVDDLQRGQQYYWKVVARDPDGNISELKTHRFVVLEYTADGYPLDVGHQWRYDYHHFFTDIRLYPDVEITPGELATFRDTTFGSSVTTITGAYGNLEAVPMAYEFSEVSVIDGYIYESGHYMANFTSGLFLVGSWGDLIGTGSTPSPPAPGRAYPQDVPMVSLWRLGMNSSQTAAQNVNSVIWETPPKKALHYPLEEGANWIYRDTLGDLTDLYVEKEVVGSEGVETPAGNFHCDVVRWLHRHRDDPNMTTSIIILDYIADEGLIKRELLAFVVLVSHGHPTGIGTATAHTEFVLREFREDQVHWPDPD